MLKRIRIKGYRGIKSLDLQDLGRVNILIGPNGSGKTTVLEAISLIANPSPYQHIKLAKWRSLHEPKLGDDHPLSSLFFAGDSQRSVYLRGEFSTSLPAPEAEIELEINPILPNEQVPIDFSFENPPQDSLIESQLRGIKHRILRNGARNEEQTLLLNPRGGRITGLSQPIDFPGCFFLDAKLSREPEESAGVVSKLLQSASLKKKFLAALRVIAPQVVDIQLGFENHSPRIYADVGAEHTIAISLLGSGFERLFHLLTGLMSTGKSLLLVDEIDSGLHYSAMESFWQDLSLLMSDESQLFCTTHNSEMLRSSLNVFPDDGLRFIRLDRNQNGIVTQTSYTVQEYKDALEFGLDIR